MEIALHLFALVGVLTTTALLALIIVGTITGRASLVFGRREGGRCPWCDGTGRTD